MAIDDISVFLIHKSVQTLFRRKKSATYSQENTAVTIKDLFYFLYGFCIFSSEFLTKVFFSLDRVI